VPPSPWISSVLAPVAAGAATLCTATAITGVVAGWAWFGYVLVAVVLVACTGLALRSLRAPAPVVGVGQLAVLTFLITGVFTTNGVLGVLPGPSALSELRDVLAAAAEQIRIGLPPVDGTPPILCLITIAVGLVAVLIDTLAVAAAAPAATGLVLLCVYAVPASLSDVLLPWWTFLLGAAGFAWLLAVDGNHRHRSWRNRDAPGLGVSPGAASAPLAVVCVALVLGLVAGTTITAVGTVGSLPGNKPDGRGGTNGGLGVNPFTSLRGMLDQGANVELFRVRGLGNDKRLLRAFTLDTYRPNQGWALADPKQMPAGVPANGSLPAAPGDTGAGQNHEIQIQPTNWMDIWLPLYGSPRALRGVPDGWFYDRASGSVYNTRKQPIAPYTEVASIREPSKQELRAAGPKTGDLPPVYTRVERIDPRVSALASQLTAGATNNFDRATALWRFFTAQHGFTYDSSTAAPADADALADFVLNGKRGFCEQFASAMGVMLRSLGVPSRVAVGFTTGYPTADYRAITSQDAHAWVEVYFGDKGWVSFDPTPLADGRGYIPPYLRPDNSPADPSTNSPDNQSGPSASQQAPTGVPGQPAAGAQPDSQGQGRQDGGAPLWMVLVTVLAVLLAAGVTVAAVVLARRRAGPGSESGLANWLPLVATGLWVVAIGLAALLWSAWFAAILLGVLLLALTPAVLREVHRRRRLREIVLRGPGAADAAWQELRDECADRGLPIPGSDTVRTAAQKVTQRHHLDEEGRESLRTVVGVLERSWYGAAAEPDPKLAPAFAGLRDSLHRNAPMSWRGRLFPKSLLRGGR
jgi:transglutaminase-like putative cysteine protease